MKKVKYLILGGGAAGLSLAASLLRKGEENFVLLEKEKEVGGLCRSIYIDGGPVDIAGGHILDIRRKKVLDLMFSFLPEEEWSLVTRRNTIKVGEYEVGYPLEANIWQFPEEEQKKYLESIAKAGCQNNEPMPEKFIDWITWKLGDKIANDYMIPYNKKIWQCDLNDLGTYWLYKLPNVSYEQTLMSCQNKKPYGNMPAHSVFYYPKNYGYGEPFLRMGKYLGCKAVTDYTVQDLDWKTRCVNEEYQADYIINTLPWQEISGKFPAEIREEIEKLVYMSVDIDYYDKEYDHHTQLTYFADETLPYHRVIYRREFTEREDVIGYWTEANSKIGIKAGKFTHTNPYAYPIPTADKEAAISKIRKWAEEQNILSIGRWGEWAYHNSDVVMEEGILLAEKLLAGK